MTALHDASRAIRERRDRQDLPRLGWTVLHKLRREEHPCGH